VSRYSFEVEPLEHSTTAYLIRHAQSHPSRNLEESQWPLSRVGADQAEKLSGLLESIEIAKLYSSPYIRCLSTITPYSKRRRLDVLVRSSLRERNVAGGVRDDFRDVWLRSWEDFSFALPGCETSFAAQDRFIRGVRKIVEDEAGSSIAVCAHGNVMGLLLNHLDANYGRAETDLMRTPDVVKLIGKGDALVWDRDFRLPGLDDIATDHKETPID
jgi:2,3-bisphosphoglycerate-dependent phosphoglycerate mutase